MSRTSDFSALRLYLDAISQLPRLSRDDEIALGVTGERVRQIEALALEKLRGNPILNTLRTHGAG